MAALGRIVLNKRGRVVMIEPHHQGLLAITLRYPYEVRAARDYFGDIEQIDTPKDMIQLAEHILDSKTPGFDRSIDRCSFWRTSLSASAVTPFAISPLTQTIAMPGSG
jgi:non-homologous end joining protein Ku